MNIITWRNCLFYWQNLQIDLYWKLLWPWERATPTCPWPREWWRRACWIPGSTRSTCSTWHRPGELASASAVVTKWAWTQWKSHISSRLRPAYTRSHGKSLNLLSLQHKYLNLVNTTMICSKHILPGWLLHQRPRRRRGCIQFCGGPEKHFAFELENFNLRSNWLSGHVQRL